MHIGINGTEFDATPANTIIFTGETLLNGVYTDLDDDYVFIPENCLEGYQDFVEQLQAECVATYEVTEYDPTASPFCFVINALCRVFADEIDQMGVSGES